MLYVVCMDSHQEKRGRSKAFIAIVIICVTLCLGVVSVGGVFAAIAIPNYLSMQLRAKRAEVPANVSGIKTSLLAYEAGFDVHLAVEQPVPRELVALNGESVPWVSGTVFDTLGWHPGGDVRGTYWVELVGEDDFIVHGMCDMDGDGVQAHYTASRSVSATMVTENHTY